MGGERKARGSKSMKASTRARSTSSRKSKAKGERRSTEIATADVAPVVVVVTTAPDDVPSTQQEAELSHDDGSLSMPQSNQEDGPDESQATIESQMVDLPHSLLEEVSAREADSLNGDQILHMDQDTQDVHNDDGNHQVVEDDGAGEDPQSVGDILEQLTQIASTFYSSYRALEKEGESVLVEMEELYNQQEERCKTMIKRLERAGNSIFAFGQGEGDDDGCCVGENDRYEEL